MTSIIRKVVSKFWFYIYHANICIHNVYFSVSQSPLWGSVGPETEDVCHRTERNFAGWRPGTIQGKLFLDSVWTKQWGGGGEEAEDEINFKRSYNLLICWNFNHDSWFVKKNRRPSRIKKTSHHSPQSPVFNIVELCILHSLYSPLVKRNQLTKYYSIWLQGYVYEIIYFTKKVN